MSQAIVTTMTNDTCYHCLLTLISFVSLTQAPQTHLLALQKLNSVAGRTFTKFLTSRKEVLFLAEMTVPVDQLPGFVRLQNQKERH